MTQKLYEESNIQDIAEAIREQNGTQNTYMASQMGDAIRAIKGNPILESLNVTVNGDYVPSSGKDGFSEVHVQVRDSSPILQEKIVNQNGIVLPDAGYDGLSKVIVDVPSGGGNELIGPNPPTDGIGEIGDYYIQELNSTALMFGITITEPARVGQSGFSYWGARDIQIVFDDGNNNEILLKDLSVKSCRYAQGTEAFTLQNENINGNTNTYYEHRTLPGYYCIECEIPQTYLLKALKIYGRCDSWRDYWRAFTFAQWLDLKTPLGNALVSETDLEYSDWAQNDYTVFNLGNVKPKSIKKLNIYYKFSDGWVAIK